MFDALKEKGKERMAICMECPFIKNKDSLHKQCGKCGCFLEAKVLVPNTHCPVNKW